MERVLIVDDDADILRLVSYNLTQAGFQVTTAATGRTALEYAQKRPPDLIILDVMLPKKNGYDVARDLRQKGITTPILMLTAKGETIDKVLGLKLGAALGRRVVRRVVVVVELDRLPDLRLHVLRREREALHVDADLLALALLRRARLLRRLSSVVRGRRRSGVVRRRCGVVRRRRARLESGQPNLLVGGVDALTAAERAGRLVAWGKALAEPADLASGRDSGDRGGVGQFAGGAGRRDRGNIACGIAGFWAAFLELPRC